MIKGWRLNPEWVRYKEEKKAELIKRQMEQVKIQAMIDSLEQEKEFQEKMDLLRRPSLGIVK